MPKTDLLFVTPLLAPLMLASATTIALRTMLMWPATGRLSDWQRREAGKMVQEKTAALQEAQVEALAIAWAAVWTPWTVWTTGDSASKAFDRAAGRILEPFSRRATGNARRLTAHAMRPVMDAMPIAGPATAALPRLRASKSVKGSKVPRRRRRSR